MLTAILRNHSGIIDIIVGAFTLISLYLILFYRPNLPEKQFLAGMFLVVLSGTLIRLLLAYSYYGNYDMYSYDIVREIVASGGMYMLRLEGMIIPQLGSTSYVFWGQ
jgi:hypothetical protein